MKAPGISQPDCHQLCKMFSLQDFLILTDPLHTNRIEQKKREEEKTPHLMQVKNRSRSKSCEFQGDHKRQRWRQFDIFFHEKTTERRDRLSKDIISSPPLSLSLSPSPLLDPKEKLSILWRSNNRENGHNKRILGF